MNRGVGVVSVAPDYDCSNAGELWVKTLTALDASGLTFLNLISGFVLGQPQGAKWGINSNSTTSAVNLFSFAFVEFSILSSYDNLLILNVIP